MPFYGPPLSAGDRARLSSSRPGVAKIAVVPSRHARVVGHHARLCRHLQNSQRTRGTSGRNLRRFLVNNYVPETVVIRRGTVAPKGVRPWMNDRGGRVAGSPRTAAAWPALRLGVLQTGTDTHCFVTTTALSAEGAPEFQEALRGRRTFPANRTGKRDGITVAARPSETRSGSSSFHLDVVGSKPR